jgi:hypothetical protein
VTVDFDFVRFTEHRRLGRINGSDSTTEERNFVPFRRFSWNDIKAFHAHELGLGVDE